MSLKNWNPDEIDISSIVFLSKVSLFRNFKNINFKDKIKDSEAKDIVSDVVNILSEENTQVIDLEKMEPEKADNYIEKYLLSEGVTNDKHNSALLLNDNDRDSFILLNNEEHICIQSIAKGLDIEKAYSKVDEIDDIIEKRKEYAFDEKYGYLTTTIDILGTGMISTVIMHLPGISLTDGIKNLTEELDREGIFIEGLYQNEDTNHGNMYQVSNKETLGVKESEIISHLQSSVLNIINKERFAREQLVKENNLELEDKIYRAYGVLKNARKVTNEESLDLISLILLGNEFDILELDKDKIGDIFRVTRDYSIETESKDQNKDIKRAELIRNIL